jgi:hypothetical protein
MKKTRSSDPAWELQRRLLLSPNVPAWMRVGGSYKIPLAVIPGVEVQSKKEGDSMLDRNTFFQAYLKAEDVKPGATFTIERFEAIKSGLARKGVQPALRLEGVDLPFALNATNFDKLITVHGNDETKWPGKKITLKHVMVADPAGKMGKGLRIA